MKIELPSQPFRYVTENSKECDAETAFIKTKQNENYVDDAKKNGAHSIITASEIAPLFGLNRIKIIGITGTNGKTTTACLVAGVLTRARHRTGLLGTLDYLASNWFLPVGGFVIALFVGWLLGRRMLLLEHRGRKSGRKRRSVLEVTSVRDGAPVVVSGFGATSDCCRNVMADPAVAVTWGRTAFAAVARRLDHDEAVEHFARYQVEHPRATKNLAERLGVPVDVDPEVAADALPAFALEPVTVD